MMTAGTGGFSGSAAATGPNAGYDPVMKFKRKFRKEKNYKKNPEKILKNQTNYTNTK